MLRVLEACNVNKNIKKLTLGYVSAKCLKLMGDTLNSNSNIEKLKFQECLDPTKRWDKASKDSFIDNLKTCKNLTKVKFEASEKTPENDEGHKMFKKEIEFIVKKIKKENKNLSEREDRLQSCTNDEMFENILKLIEEKDEHQKMPVRKFFNNTFGSLLNDAIFALMKKQQKSKSNTIFTMQGSIRFVAHYLQDHLPENETHADSEDEEGEETDEL
uniref:Uncharacterized protein n=1 Tax=Strombidium inclinatum TaxID=197538 RepID=A0A7S3MUL3_9SPIT|mmetsp:Transcript_15300/g.23561  ORF Transcript_15300/g.23561 Transcript_15300/m.23561 type:complete len:216 (+) Transcript_15300:439-1086(+)